MRFSGVKADVDVGAGGGDHWVGIWEFAGGRVGILKSAVGKIPNTSQICGIWQTSGQTSPKYQYEIPCPLASVSRAFG